MKTKLNIELNKEELRLLSNQIKIEFANSNRQVTQLLDCKEKENKRRYQTGFPGPKFDPEYYSKISARLNKHMQDCCRLAIISKAFKCDEGVYEVDGQYYDEMMLRELIADEALKIAHRYFDLIKNNGGYCFDDIIDEFKYDNDDRKTMAHWERKFRLIGCNKDQMARVKQRIDELLEEGELAGTKNQED